MNEKSSTSVAVLTESPQWDRILRKYKWGVRQITDFNNADRANILNLVRSHYGNADETYPEYFQWEYIDNPCGRAIIWVAMYQKEFVGQYILNPMRIKIGDVVRKGGLAIKTITRSDFRGKGIHIYLAKKAFETIDQVDFMYGFPNKTVFTPCVRRLGYRVVGKVPLMIKPLDTGKLIGRYIKIKICAGILAIPASLLLKSYDFFISLPFFKKSPFNRKEVYFREINEFDKRFDEFWQKIKAGHKNILV
ncbi:MAG: GNAT family N-acetyltransferase, partial [Candidatus Omnitrophica bacterium]|nr:GNAT family N-acetyltransferase [Candidatus Omnitrophota bacterium]